MDLRAKTFLIIGLTLLGGIVLIILFSSTILSESYVQVEKNQVRENLVRGLKVLAYEQDQLISVTSDWGRWDETYNYVQDRDDEYISRNLNYASIENLGIDFLLYLRQDESLKQAMQIHPVNETVVPLSDEAVHKILSIPGFLSFDSILDIHSGIVILEGVSALVVCEPVITSTYEGPHAGFLVFGSNLDPDKVRVLSDLADVDIQISRDFSAVGSDTAPVTWGKEGEPEITIIPESHEYISGYTFLPTMDADGVIRFSVTMPRDIVNQGRNTVAMYTLFLVFFGLLICIVALITLDRLVLYRLKDLIRKIQGRNRERSEAPDILIDSDDELADLARVIHPVFLELNRSQKQLEEHVRLLTESERKYRELADLLPEFVFECDQEGNISFLNQMGLDVAGYSREEHKSGLHILDFIDHADHPRMLSALVDIRMGTPISGDEYLGYTKKGDSFPMIVYTAPIRTSNEITGFRGFAIDISERKRYELSLKKLADIVEYTSTGIVTGTGDVVDYANAAYSKIHGMEQDEFIGRSPFIVIADRLERKFTTFLEIALQTGHTAFEMDHIRKDGTRFPALHHLTVLSGTTADTAFWSLNIQDITEQRQAWKALIESEALRESARQLRDVISRLPDATFVIDKDGWVIFWNQAMELLTGIHETDIVGRGHYEYALPFYGEKRPMLINAVLDKEDTIISLFPGANRSGNSIFTEESFPRIEKGGKYFSTMAGPIYDSRGVMIGAIQSMRDITSRIMAERALLRTNEKLNLLSSITRHDIRNRVSVILGLLPMLESDSVDPEQKEILQIIKSAAKLIHDQIEFTRVYQDLGVHSPEWKDVGVIVNKVSEVGIPERVKVVNELSGVTVYADPLLERVFFNLIDNALRHGGDTLSVIRFSWRLEDDLLCISCEDDGTGISEDLKAMIFERGYGSNTGLGLFLVREILSITGISIIETGKAGAGARFEIRIPPGGYTLSEN